MEGKREREMSIKPFVIYISGKYSAKTKKEIKKNIELARKYALKIWKKGFPVICPHLNTAFMEDELSYDLVLDGDIEILSRCDALFLLPNWKRSKGAKKEREIAIKENLLIIESKDLNKLEDLYLENLGFNENKEKEERKEYECVEYDY
ncbi:MAG: DUF4406 domain-containing protein [Promethearchaeota archaeon]